MFLFLTSLKNAIVKLNFSMQLGLLLILYLQEKERTSALTEVAHCSHLNLWMSLGAY